MVGRVGSLGVGVAAVGTAVEAGERWYFNEVPVPSLVLVEIEKKGSEQHSGLRVVDPVSCLARARAPGP